MNQYETKASSETVSSIRAIFFASVIAAGFITNPRGTNRADLELKPKAYSVSEASPTFNQYGSVLTGEYFQESKPSEDNVLTVLNPIIRQLTSWIDSIAIPQKWEEEGIQQPTLECRKLTKSIILRLLIEQRLHPSRISATIEEGVFVNYVNHINNCNLAIEIYNDLDIAVIVTRDKEIINSWDIIDGDLTKAIKIFQAV